MLHVMQEINAGEDEVSPAVYLLISSYSAGQATLKNRAVLRTTLQCVAHPSCKVAACVSVVHHLTDPLPAGPT